MSTDIQDKRKQTKVNPHLKQYRETNQEIIHNN